MNQFDKNKIITLDIQEPQQIKAALIQYQAMLISGEAFKEEQFDVEFRHSNAGKVRRLQTSDAGSNFGLLESALIKGQGGSERYLNEEITDQSEVYISEPILFAAALQYPELTETIVATVKAIVDYSRRVNDTDEIWIDDTDVFGVEAVYMLAKTDLQYLYLLGQFFFPYWDEDHTGDCIHYLAEFLAELGWHPEVIKAYIWCDNASFRLGMFMNNPYSDTPTHQALGEYLTENPCQYGTFKQSVIERFQAEPVLLYSYDEHSDEEEDLSGCNPVVWLYETLFPRRRHFYDDDLEDAFMQQPFMGSTLENEAYDLQGMVKGQVDGLLVKPAESALRKRARYKAYQERDEHRYDLNYGTEVLKPLILAMPQGDRLWLYIESGTERDALDVINEIELIPLAKAHAPLMFEHIDDQLCSWQYNNRGILDEIENILDLARDDLLTDHFGDESTIELANGLTTTLTVTLDSNITLLAARREQYLRIVDVFYRALGKREFNEYMMESLTEEDEPLLSRQDYYRRYSQLDEAVINGSVNETTTATTTATNGILSALEGLDPALARDVQSIFGTFIDRDEILYKLHFQRVDGVLRTSRELCHPKLWADCELADMGFFALASYQLFNDFNQRIGDDVTEALFNFLNEQHIWQMAAAKIIRSCRVRDDHHFPNSGLIDADITRIKAYFTADKPEDDQAELLALITPHLYRDDVNRGELHVNKFSEYQPGYTLFHDRDDDFQRFTLIAFWLRQLPLPLRVQADRLWRFLIALAPVRVARNIMRAHSDEPWDVTINNPLDEIDVTERLEKAGITSGQLNAYEMSRHFHDNKCYQQWLDAYSEITSTATGMFGSIDRKKAEAMCEGLKYINEHTKIDFLHDVSLKYPEVSLDIEHDLKRALKLMVRLNIRSWENALAYEYGQACLYVGDGDDAPENLLKPIASDQHTVHDKPCYVDGCSWLKSTVLQQCGEQNIILMADHEVPLDSYQHSLPRGTLLIFNSEVENKTLLARIAELQDTTARIEHLCEQTWAYLEGEIDYDSIANLYNAHLAMDGFRPSLDEYRLYSMNQFIWTLDKPRRNRLAKLLLNQDCHGFKVLDENYEKCWLLHRLEQGEIDFNEYFEKVRESQRLRETSEEAMQFMLNWLIEIGVNLAHITRFCIKHTQFDVCCEFIQNHARGIYDHKDQGSFAQTLAYLYAGRRAQLPEILSRANDASQLMEPLTKDKSRLVKEAVMKFMVH